MIPGANRQGSGSRTTAAKRIGGGRRTDESSLRPPACDTLKSLEEIRRRCSPSANSLPFSLPHSSLPPRLPRAWLRRRPSRLPLTFPTRRASCITRKSICRLPWPLTLTTPEWIPGTHMPFGPAQTITGVVFTANGHAAAMAARRCGPLRVSPDDSRRASPRCTPTWTASSPGASRRSWRCWSGKSCCSIRPTRRCATSPSSPR